MLIYIHVCFFFFKPDISNKNQNYNGRFKFRFLRDPLKKQRKKHTRVFGIAVCHVARHNRDSISVRWDSRALRRGRHRNGVINQIDGAEKPCSIVALESFFFFFYFIRFLRAALTAVFERRSWAADGGHSDYYAMKHSHDTKKCKKKFF